VRAQESSHTIIISTERLVVAIPQDFSSSGVAGPRAKGGMGTRSSEQAAIPDRVELRPCTADDSLGRDEDDWADGYV
jgi:hypothetical protein